MFGVAPFGSLYFGEAFLPLNLTVDTEPPRGGHFAHTGKRRKRKRTQQPPVQHWPVIWPQDAPERAPVPAEVTASLAIETLATDQPRPVFSPPQSLVDALSGKTQLDAATRKEIDALKLRLRQEIEDEEALLLLGAFD